MGSPSLVHLAYLKSVEKRKDMTAQADAVQFHAAKWHPLPPPVAPPTPGPSQMQGPKWGIRKGEYPAEVCRPKKCDGRTQASVGRKADSVQQSRTNGTLHFWLPPRFPSVAVFGCRPFPRLWRRLWPPSSARSGASFGRPLGRPRLPSPLLPRAAPVGATLAATAAGLPDSRWGFPFQGCPRPPRLLNGVRACPTPSPRTRPRRRHRRC